ncbi:MAG: cytochrome c family protein [Rhodospirillales bacterium]|nr:cytochrome c family protein [Rhodospirillales bacterium]
MSPVFRLPIPSGFLAVAVFLAFFLAATPSTLAGEKIVNGNQVAIVTSQLTVRMDAADPVKGEKIFKQRCRSCHTQHQGGPNKTGPNLWDVVGRKLGSQKGFKYSQDMTTMNNHWGYEELDKFLTKPYKFVASTRMTFPGLKKQQDRANLISYLRTNSLKPLPLPSEM